MKRTATRLLLLLPLLVLCCVEPYPIKSTDYRRQLVVEGLISGVAKKHRVVLSSTSPLNTSEIIPEQGATVSITHGSETIKLTESSAGIYETPVVQGITGDSYQLHFTTKDGKQYSSEEVVLKKSPDIKSVYAKYLKNQPSIEDGVHFYLDTEDPTGEARYYRWEFEGTYEIKTPYPSAFEWLGGNDVVFRDISVDRCWAADTSRSIVLGTTAGLNDDRITAIPILYIPFYSYSLRIKYSLLIRQYVMSDKSYIYWKTLKDINQTQGSLFDVQPGTLRGNVRSTTDDKEAVLGYFDACTVSEVRAFFTPDNFSKDGFKTPKFLTSCENFIPIEVRVSKIGDFMKKDGNDKRYIISEAVGTGDPTLLMRPVYCCDCRNLGTNIRPSFWQ